MHQTLIIVLLLVVVGSFPVMAADEFALLKEERIGPLRIDLPEQEVERRIACKPHRGPVTPSDVDGDYYQEWAYPACGIRLDRRASDAERPPNHQFHHDHPPQFLENPARDRHRQHRARRSWPPTGATGKGKPARPVNAWWPAPAMAVWVFTFHAGSGSVDLPGGRGRISEPPPNTMRGCQTGFSTG